MKHLFAFTALCLSITFAYADNENLTAVQKFRGTVNGSIFACSLELKSALLINEAKRSGVERYDLPEQVAPDWRSCIAKQKSETKANYESTLKTVKKAAAKAAFKEYFIAAIISLDEIEPKAGEIKMDYTRRQSANDQKLNEKWTRFDVEQ